MSIRKFLRWILRRRDPNKVKITLDPNTGEVLSVEYVEKCQ